jgi:sulfonate transport system substrate-binding protein
VVSLALAVGVKGCARVEPGSAPVPIRIAIPLQPSSALMLVAMHHGFFEAEGLAPDYLFYSSGKRAIEEGFLAGHADIASASDLPVAQCVLRRESLQILCTLQTVRSLNYVVGRRGTGFTQLADLAALRTGTQPFSAVHYFLHRVLFTQEIAPAQAQILFYPIEELPDALARGEVDAISVREPYLSQALALLQEEAVYFEAPWIYPQFELLVVHDAFAAAQPEALDRIIRALVRAECWAAQHPEDTVAVLAQHLQIPADMAAAIHRNTINALLLPHALLLSMEDQMRWVAQQEDQPNPPLPNLLEFLNIIPLHNVLPYRACASGFCQNDCL